MTTHELKVHSQFFNSLWTNEKNFEVRRDDRGFAVHDVLVLREYDPSFGYTGNMCKRLVTYVLRSEDLPNGVPPGWCVMALSNDI